MFALNHEYVLFISWADPSDPSNWLRNEITMIYLLNTDPNSIECTVMDRIRLAGFRPNIAVDCNNPKKLVLSLETSDEMTLRQGQVNGGGKLQFS